MLTALFEKKKKRRERTACENPDLENSKRRKKRTSLCNASCQKICAHCVFNEPRNARIMHVTFGTLVTPHFVFYYSRVDPVYFGLDALLPQGTRHHRSA